MIGGLLTQIVEDLRRAVAANPDVGRRSLDGIAQDVVAGAPACVLVADGTGRLVAASSMALTLLGHSLTSLRTTSVTDVAGEPERDVVEPLWESFLRERRQSGPFLLRRRDGSSFATVYVAEAHAVEDLSVAVHMVVSTEK